MAKKTSYSEPHQLPQTLTGTVAILLTISAVRYQKQSFDLQNHMYAPHNGEDL